MAYITSDWCKERRVLIEGEIKRLQGALEMIGLVEERLAAPNDSMSLDDLGAALGGQAEVVDAKEAQ